MHRPASSTLAQLFLFKVKNIAGLPELLIALRLRLDVLIVQRYLPPLWPCATAHGQDPIVVPLESNILAPLVEPILAFKIKVGSFRKPTIGAG